MVSAALEGANPRIDMSKLGRTILLLAVTGHVLCADVPEGCTTSPVMVLMSCAKHHGSGNLSLNNFEITEIMPDAFAGLTITTLCATPCPRSLE